MITTEQFLQAALNGDRIHPAVPRTPDEIAKDTVAAVAAGAQSVHVHVFDDEGRQTLAADYVARVLRAVRAVSPQTPISLTTSADVEADPASRYRAVEAWSELPDLVTANQGEDGIVDLCELLASRGVGIEAGLLSFSDAEAFVASGAARWCVRVMVEPLDADPDTAVAHAEAIEKLVTEAGITLEQVHHGDGIASWSVNQRAIPLGHGIRTGLEDTTVLPDGRQARDNAECVSAAVAMLGR
ncbi:MAG: aldolase [Pseudonocardiales bacterium]|nr:MAG: aldolase [Pseudonocardiales bacterium]